MTSALKVSFCVLCANLTENLEAGRPFGRLLQPQVRGDGGLAGVVSCQWWQVVPFLTWTIP